MKVVTKHISITVTRICTILVILGCVQTYANSSRFSELEKDAVNNSENLEFGTGKKKNGESLDSLPGAFICPCRRGPILLVQPIWDIKGNLIQPTGIDRYHEENIVFLYTPQIRNYHPMHD